MRDGGEFQTARLMAKLRREIDEGELKRRNALRKMAKGLKLRVGDTLRVLETFGSGEAFLVERAADKEDNCDWMGVLYPAEIEVVEAESAKRARR
jgi:hypothetical protein